MRAIKKTAAICLAMFAFAAVAVAPAGAETLRIEEKGQPLASGKVFGEDTHGVIHCPAVADLLGSSTPGSAPGVVVVKPGERFALGAPQGGQCEEIYEIFAP